MNINSTDPLKQLSSEERFKQDPKTNDLGKDDFLRLMIAQMENQNPLEPQQNAEFVAQLAQFSTVEGIQNLSGNFDRLASSFGSSQALQASTLVGRSVTIDGNVDGRLYWGDLVQGMVDVPAGVNDLRLVIEDERGNIIEQHALGNRPQGMLDFRWDGINIEVGGELLDFSYDHLPVDEDGNILPHAEGGYRFTVLGSLGSETQALATSVSQRVDSVSLNNNKIVLNLAGGGTAEMSQVARINSL